MIRVLHFVPRDCRPTNTGGRLRNYHLACGLSRFAEVTYLCFADEKDPGAQPPQAPRIIRVPHPEKKSPAKLLQGLLGKTPYTVLNYTEPAMKQALEALLKEQTFDVVQMESLLLDEYLPTVRALQPHALVICDWHNVDSEVLQRYARHAPNLGQKIYALVTAKKLLRLERESLQTYDAHLTVSDRDTSRLQALKPGVQAFTVENGVDTAAFVRPAEERSPRKRLIFVGSMDYYPNVDGSLYFAREVWPFLHAKKPDWTFTIVGRSPSPEVLALGSEPGIEVTGTVPDVGPYYDEALAAIVPLRVGGGSRLKILESMSAGVPIVSTTLGAEGLAVQDGETILIRDTPDALAAAVLALDEQADLRDRLIENGRRLALARYDWHAVGRGLEAIYHQLLAEKARPQAAS